MKYKIILSNADFIKIPVVHCVGCRDQFAHRAHLVHLQSGNGAQTDYSMQIVVEPCSLYPGLIGVKMTSCGRIKLILDI